MIVDFIKGSLWSGGALVILSLLQLLSVYVLSRLLLPEVYGQYVPFFIFYNFIKVYYQSFVVTQIVLDRNSSEAIDRGKIIYLACMGVLAAGGGCIVLIGGGFYGTSARALVVGGIILIAFLEGFSSLFEAGLTKRLDFATAAISNVVSYATGQLVVTVLLANIGFGYESLVLGLAVSSVIRLCMIARFSKVSISLAPSKATYFHYCKTGSIFFLTESVNFMALQGDQMFVADQRTQKEAGLYTRALQIAGLPVQFYSYLIDKVAFGVFAKRAECGDLLAAHKMLYATLVGSAVVVSLALSAFSEKITALLMGPQWEGVAPLFSVLSMCLGFRAAYKLNETYMRVSGDVSGRLFRQVFYALAIVVGCWLAKDYSLKAVAWAVLLANVGYCGISIIALVRTTPMSIQDAIIINLPLLATGLYGIT